MHVFKLKLKQMCREESVSTFADVNAKWERMVWPIKQLDMDLMGVVQYEAPPL